MPRRQSKQCKFGELCDVPRCPFRHPDREFFTNARESANESKRDSLPSQNIQDLELLRNAHEFEHSNALNLLAAEVEFINWYADAPYAIQSHPDLGFFATWDDAYDTLLRATYVAA